ncbi:MAG: hypothetical protein LBT33_05230 [Spirochaetia bacterium]|jgi:hypothetical protein|nr:hypothetical protein [Spirochaetia bacterium]
MGANEILVKLLLLALNLMPLDQAGFNFHVLEGGRYAASYRAERRDQDFTVFRPAAEDGRFPAFDAERSRRFGRTYTVRVQETGEMLSVSLTDIMLDMPPLSALPRQILKAEAPPPARQNAAEAPADTGAGAGENTGAEGESPSPGGDIIIDGVGRTLFLTVDGQTLTIAAEINAPL